MKKLEYLAPMLLLLLTSCDLSRELNENTLALSTTVSQIHNQQVIENLQIFIDDPSAIPAQVVLSGGGVQVTNSISPSFQNFIRPWKAFSASYTNSYTQNWAVSPVNDPDDVRRLRALYRIAVYGDQQDRTAQAALYGKTVWPAFEENSQDVNFESEYPQKVLLQEQKQVVRDPDRNCNEQSPLSGCPTYPYYYPRSGSAKPFDSSSFATHLNVSHQWLFWNSGPLGIGAPEFPFRPPTTWRCPVIWPLYFSSTRFKHTLFSCSNKSTADAWRQFDEFALWIWGATSNSLGGGGSAGANSQGSGGGGTPRGAPRPVMTTPAHG